MTAWMTAWLCQGLLLAAGVSCILRLIPQLNAATRHVLWWSALAALVWMGYSTSPLVDLPVVGGGLPADVDPSSVAIEISPAPEWLLATIVAMWLSATFIKLARVIPDLHALHKLQDACVGFPAAIEEQLPLWMSLRTEGRRAALMMCDQLSGPALLGLHHPRIAIPARLLSALTLRELDQIVVHEYAHVQRRDDWMRLLQVLVESALWIHPAARWIGRGISVERELACDDWVVSHTHAAKEYARCLAHAAELSGRSPRTDRGRLFVPALFERKRDLVARVNHLLDSRRNTARRLSVLMASAGICAIAWSTASLKAFPLVVERLGGEALPGISLPPSSGKVIPAVVSWPQPVETAGQGGMVQAFAQPPGVRPLTIFVRGLTPATAPASDERGPRGSAAEVSAPGVLEGRTFNGLYRASVPSGQTSNTSATETKSPNGWATAGAAGTAIGSSARKASVSLAGAFSRAGVSIARSFD